MSKDPRCVYVADTQASALGTSHWLERFGIENVLVDKTTLGISHGVSFSSDDPAADGWQVWVKDPGQVELARELMREREESRQQRIAQGDIEACCESCGTTTRFGGAARGTIQNCPRCGGYVDVPGGEDEFEWPDDFGLAQS